MIQPSAHSDMDANDLVGSMAFPYRPLITSPETAIRLDSKMFAFVQVSVDAEEEAASRSTNEVDRTPVLKMAETITPVTPWRCEELDVDVEDSG